MAHLHGGRFAFASITGLDAVALLLLLFVWFAGVALADYSEASALLWARRLDLGTRAYAVATLLATVAIWLPFAVGSYPGLFLEGSRGQRRLLLVLSVAGASLVWTGFYYAAGALTSLRSFVAIRRIDAVDAGDVDSGPVQVSGTVEPLAESLEAPLSGREAVCYELAVGRTAVADSDSDSPLGPDTDADDSSGSSRSGTAAGTGGFGKARLEETRPIDEARTPFLLADETGRVAVDPADATLHVAEAEMETATVVVPADERPSGSFRTHLLGETDYEPTDHRETYREATVEPGDELTVIGVARTDGSSETEESDPDGRDGASLPTIDGGGDGTASEFIVAPGCERRVDRRFRRTVAGCVFAAVGLSGSGLLALSVTAGLW